MATETTQTDTTALPDLPLEVDDGTKKLEDAVSIPLDAPVESGSYIGYRVEYLDSIRLETIHQHNSRTDPADVSTGNSHKGPAFEIVTTYSTNISRADAEALKGGPPSATALARTSIHIHSAALITALQSVVKYYPGQSLAQEPIIVSEPYPVLVHHEEELAEYRTRCAPGTKDLCVREKDAYEHLGMLQDFVERTVMSSVRAERERNTRGYRTFDWFWVSRKPGMSYRDQSKNEDFVQGYVVKELTGGTFVKPSRSWNLYCWSLTYDGEYVGRCDTMITFDKHDGEAKDGVFSQVLNFEKHRDEDIIRSMVERGKKFANLLQQQCRYYRGMTIGFPQTLVIQISHNRKIPSS
jgi:hypothetical protein